MGLRSVVGGYENGFVKESELWFWLAEVKLRRERGGGYEKLWVRVFILGLLLILLFFVLLIMDLICCS